MFKKAFILFVSILLTACSSIVKYHPVETISRIDKTQGYRLANNLSHADDEFFTIMTFSGGGTRAAALGYGVLEAFQNITLSNHKNLLDSIDLVYGVSGGSILAAYFSLYGSDTVPSFEKNFLRQNFQKNLILETLSVANAPRLAASEYGRGDLLQEQLELFLFGRKTFADLDLHRKGPFAVISATDMGSGYRFDFTQETFDSLCLNLHDLRIARAVASSSAVPIIFSPLTLNNNGGNCHYQTPEYIQAQSINPWMQQQKTAEELYKEYHQYDNSQQRPYIHLLDGGLTDNLGLRNMLELVALQGKDNSNNYLLPKKVKHMIVITVNAQNKLQTPIDKSAEVPSLSDVINTVINVPIDQNSITSIRQFRSFVDEWNQQKKRNRQGDIIQLHFISLNLYDLPDSPFKNAVLNIPTSFHLPPQDIENLKKAARILLSNSADYQAILHRFQLPAVAPSVRPIPSVISIPSINNGLIKKFLK